jgi:hypothetical protein
MIPHYHIKNGLGETETTFFIQNEILKSVLELVFNTDIGEGHLENIQVEDNHIDKIFDFNDSTNSICNKTEKVIVECLVFRKEIIGYMQPTILMDRFNIGLIGRGPPLLIS